jgi:hypothetical protein
MHAKFFAVPVWLRLSANRRALWYDTFDDQLCIRGDIRYERLHTVRGFRGVGGMPVRRA